MESRHESETAGGRSFKGNSRRVVTRISVGAAATRTTCLNHAADLVRAAKCLLLNGEFPHLAFHLGTLALEEIGKADLILVDQVGPRRQEEEDRLRKWHDDHEKKLFWALWLPTFGREPVTGKKIESMQGMAKDIHQHRLKGLYVDGTVENAPAPKLAISRRSAQRLLKLANIRLKGAKSEAPAAWTRQERRNIEWFCEATDDPEKRRLILGGPSLKKLVDLGSTLRWAGWLRREFEKSDKEAKERLRRELARQPPAETERSQPKWKLKVRLFSDSHSIRAQILNEWNSLGTPIRLLPVTGKKNQLILEHTMPKVVPLQGVWYMGFSFARQFVMAMNIGSLGFFWWYLPEQISCFYETITDVESNTDVRVERSPRLKLDWGQGNRSRV